MKRSIVFRIAFCFSLLTAAFFLTAPRAQAAEPTYKSYFSGDPTDVSPQTSPGLLLAGGGDGYDDGMQWFVDHSGRGDIVVVRFTDSAAYNTWILSMGANSVETLVIPTREAAADPYVIERISQAEGVFIAGGDQSNYVRNWKDTPVEAEINNLAHRGGVVGGTSAGLAVLGAYVFSAMNGSLTTVDALANPFHVDLTMDRNFLDMPFLSHVLTDSHFGIRNRMGRLITMLSRLEVDRWSDNTYGLGIDEGAAMVIDEQGIGTMLGAGGSAYLVRLSRSPNRCMANQSLEVRQVQVDKIVKGSSLNLKTMTPSLRNHYEINVIDGVLTSSIGTD